MRYRISLHGENATFSIGDSFRKSVRHPSFASPKANLSLSFHFGTMEVRGLRVLSL
jgi:hypothetical protein